MVKTREGKQLVRYSVIVYFESRNKKIFLGTDNEEYSFFLVCGTGVGISLAANKVPGIRAGVCSEPYTARMIVEHNNCQIVAMGARVVGDELAKAIVDAFFGATFQGGRHAERVQIIKDMEAELYKPEAL